MTFQAYLDNVKAKTGKTPEDFAGKKQHWRVPCEELIAQVAEFGSDVRTAVGGTYLSLLRAGRKFAILQPAGADRLDIGIKLKGVAQIDRYETAGAWNSMVTHRVKIGDAKQIDAQLLTWLRRAYEAAA